MTILIYMWVTYATTAFIGMWVATPNPDLVKISKLFWHAFITPNMSISAVYLYFTSNGDDIPQYRLYDKATHFAAATVFSILIGIYFLETSTLGYYTSSVVIAVLLCNLYSFVYNAGKADAFRSTNSNTFAP